MSREKFDSMIGRLDRMLSEFLATAKSGECDEYDRQTIKHHAEDLIGVGNAALKAIGVHWTEYTKEPISPPIPPVSVGPFTACPNGCRSTQGSAWMVNLGSLCVKCGKIAGV